ncbi:MAG: nucleotidyl transferase AbiEii/AbiGii toxin family protein, partial [Candidatus Binatia bacterium]
SEPGTLVCVVDRTGPVTVSFFGGLPLRRVANPERAGNEGPLTASLLDLAATKVKVVQDRAEAKDYLDVARLLREGIGLRDALAAALAVYGPTFNPLLSLKALSYFGDGDLPSLSDEARQALSRAVRETPLDAIRDTACGWPDRRRPMNPTLESIAERVIWWKPPAEALADRRHFLARVMAAGTFEEVRFVRACFPPEAFQVVLDDPPPGVFDPRSWAYWHLVLGRGARELGRRRLPAHENRR